jgi:hypothetical protein
MLDRKEGKGTNFRLRRALSVHHKIRNCERHLFVEVGGNAVLLTEY